MRFLLTGLLIGTLKLIPVALPAQDFGFQVGPGSGFGTDASTQAPVAQKPTDFLRLAAEEIKVPFENLKILDRVGFGKIELLILALIHQKSGKPLKEVVETREKGTRLSKITKDQNLDYPHIYKEAWELRETVERELATRPLAPLVPPPEEGRPPEEHKPPAPSTGTAKTQ